VIFFSTKSPLTFRHTELLEFMGLLGFIEFITKSPSAFRPTGSTHSLNNSLTS
jgi:hypothetical protein